MADSSRVLFRDNESELEEHEAPRWNKLKRADEPFSPDLDLQGDISGEDSTDQDHAGDQADLCKESPHVIFSVPPDILQSHESSRNSQLKIADDMYLNIGDVMSPHVSFLGPEVVLREHELPRPTSYKKGDEPPNPCTVEVAPYRALFQTPEDLLHAHDLPRAPALKMTDEVFVQPDTLSPDTGSPAHSPRENHHTEENRFQCDQKSRVPSFWHNNLVAGALRTLSMACPITDVEREHRVTAVKGSYTHIVERQPNPFVSLSRLEETLLRVESMKMVHQVTTALLRDLGTALHLAGEDDTLKQEDFTALLLTLGALSNQRAFLEMLSDVQCRLLRPPSPPTVHNMCTHRNRRVNLDQMSESSTCSHPSICSDLDGPSKGV